MTPSAGRSFSDVIRSKCPMAFLSFTCRMPFGSFSKGAFQSPKEQCCLKAAILQSIEPLFSKKGIPHLIVSVASGQALCTRLRKWFRMGLAKSADLAIYASMRLSVAAIGRSLGIEYSLFFPHPAVQQLDPEGKRHREIDVSFVDMHMVDRLEPFEEKTESDHQQKGQCEDLDGRAAIDKSCDRPRKKEHEDHGQHHGRDHDGDLLRQPDGGDDAVE